MKKILTLATMLGWCLMTKTIKTTIPTDGKGWDTVTVSSNTRVADREPKQVKQETMERSFYKNTDDMIDAIEEPRSGMNYFIVGGYKEVYEKSERTKRIIFADSESDCKEYSFREFDKAQE